MSATGSRSATGVAFTLILIGSIGVQGSSALMLGVFESVGVYGASAMRLVGAAAVLLVIFRPGFKRRSGSEWLEISLLGAAMAAMTALLYLAIDRLPLGIAVTINFLGPCLLALSTSRRVREGILAIIAFAGVALIAGLGGALDALGLLYAGLAAASTAAYVVLATRTGKRQGGLQAMTLALCVGAVMLSPLGIYALPRIGPGDWGVLGIGAAGLALACITDPAAGRLTSARVVGVLFATGPMISLLIGTLWLDQVLTLPAFAGAMLVIIAGVGMIWFAESPGLARRDPASR